MARSAYMTIDGPSGIIPGDVTASGYEGTIEVLGFSHEVAVDLSVGSGRTSTFPQHGPLRVLKRIDPATPLLAKAVYDADVIQSVLLQVFTTAPDGTEQQNYEIELRNVRVQSVRAEQLDNGYDANVDQPPREHVAFVYERIEVIWLPDGTSASTSTVDGAA